MARRVATPLNRGITVQYTVLAAILFYFSRNRSSRGWVRSCRSRHPAARPGGTRKASFRVPLSRVAKATLSKYTLDDSPLFEVSYDRVVAHLYQGRVLYISTEMCEYQFSLEDWRQNRDSNKISEVEEVNLSIPTANRNWKCPHDSFSDSEYCIFHMDYNERRERELSPMDVQEYLIDTIKSESEPNEFIGAKFGTINLEHRNISPGNDGVLNFKFVEFGGQVDIRHCKVSKISFNWSIFREKSSFHLSEFTDDAIFFGCEFFQRFTAPELHKYSNFDGSIFHNKAIFKPNTNPHLSIRNVEFRGDISCSFGDFEKIYFHDSKLCGGVNMHSLDVDELIVRELDVNGTHLFNLDSSNIKSGHIKVEDGLSIIYNLSNATIGDVDFELPDNELPFRPLWIKNTEFDGFDFSSYREVLEKCSYTIHGSIAVDSSIELPSLSEIETTYLKAREGAEKSGDNKAASEFFIKEMKHRRKSTQERFHETDSLTEKSRYLTDLIGNLVMGSLSRYGESPARVVTVSLLTVLLYSILYPLAGGVKGPSDNIISYFSNSSMTETILNSTYFSVTSFTTVGYGDFQPQTAVSKGLAASESLFGALLLALLIFVLGRSVKW